MNMLKNSSYKHVRATCQYIERNDRNMYMLKNSKLALLFGPIISFFMYNICVYRVLSCDPTASTYHRLCQTKF